MVFWVTRFLIALLFQITTSTSENLCEQGWYQYKNEKCFKPIGDDLKTWNISWDYANKICTSEYKGQLASIHSIEENDFIYKLLFTKFCFKSNVWLGGKRVSGKVFRWIDGTPFNYTNWGKQHNQPSGDGDCMEVWSPCFSKDCGVPKDFSRWNDIYCDHNRQAGLCQKIIEKSNEETCKKQEEENQNLKDQVLLVENKISFLIQQQENLTNEITSLRDDKKSLTCQLETEKSTGNDWIMYREDELLFHIKLTKVLHPTFEEALEICKMYGATLPTLILHMKIYF